MKRFVRSDAFARTRAVTGTLFIALGAAIVVRTFAKTGLAWTVTPSVVLGGAMILLGIVRIRDFLVRTRA
jgi:hypothetical protein